MTVSTDRLWARLGAAGALAAWTLSLVRVLAELTAARRLYTPHAPSDAAPFASYWSLAVLEAGALALAVLATDRLMRRRNRVLLAGLVAGLMAALMLAGGALAAIPLGATDRRAALAAQLASVPLGAWMLCVASADWRMRRLPGWLRVVGAALGAVLVILPAVPQLRLALVVAPAWWVGLAVALLRGAPRVNGSGAPSAA